MTIREVSARAALLAAAVVFGLAGPAVLGAIFGLAAIVNVGELLSRLHTGHDLAGRILFAGVGVLALLLVLGVVLNELPGQLSHTNWTVGWGVLATVVLTATWRLGGAPRPGYRRPPAAALVACGLLALGTVAGLIVAWQGVSRERSTQVLALSAPWHDQRTARVVVQSVGVSGVYQLEVWPDGDQARSVPAGEISLAGHRSPALTRQVRLPGASTHWAIVLSHAGPRRPRAREVILWK